MGSDETTSDKKKKQYANKCTQSLPILSSTFAAFLTEGKTVKEMETLALFFDALANDIFLIAAVTDKNDIIVRDFPLL